MTLCRNDVLCLECNVANRALFALGKTDGRAGCFYCGYYFLGVALCRNYLLRNGNLTAGGAFFAFGKACFGAGCFYCSQNCFGVYMRGGGLFGQQQVTRSDRKHHNHSVSYSQNAKYVFSFHTRKPP